MQLSVDPIYLPRKISRYVYCIIISIGQRLGWNSMVWALAVFLEMEEGYPNSICIDEYSDLFGT